MVEVLKGNGKLLGTAVQAPLFDERPLGGSYLVLGNQQNEMQWAPPYALSKRSRQYVSDIVKLPAAGTKRLVYFQNYLEDPEELLGKDAFDEFALAPYSAVQAMKSQLQHDKLVERVQDASVTPSHRRQYLTMLGVCGTAADLPILENLLRSEDPKFKPGLDATVACYLMLKGPAGLPLVEDLYLKPKTDEFTDIFAVVMALRFLGQDEHGPIPRERIIASMRLVLDHPRLADQAIMDLARWQDWTVMDRLVTMFKSNDPEVNTWVRIPVINYLRSCPLPIAKKHIEELRKIDPKAVQQSESVYDALGLTGGTATVPAAAATDARAQKAVPVQPAAEKPAAEQAATEEPAAAAESPAAAVREPAHSNSNSNSKKPTAGSLPAPVLWGAVMVGVFGGLLLFAASVRGTREIVYHVLKVWLKSADPFAPIRHAYQRPFTFRAAGPKPRQFLR